MYVIIFFIIDKINKTKSSLFENNFKNGKPLSRQANKRTRLKLLKSRMKEVISFSDKNH